MNGIESRPGTSTGGSQRHGPTSSRPRSPSRQSQSRNGPVLQHQQQRSYEGFAEDQQQQQPPPKTAVKVAVRVRPPPKENEPGYELVPARFRGLTCQVPNETTLSIESSKGKKIFLFDKVLGDSESQEDIWAYVGDSVGSFIQGYNVSILAYGQSGAGKSYTMGTASPGEQSDAHDKGIIPRAAATLFAKLTGSAGKSNGTGIRPPSSYSAKNSPMSQSFPKQEDRSWELKATYVEIYNEQLRDLLVPENTPMGERGSVTIREDAKGRILLTGLQQVTINSFDDLQHALNFGSTIRQTDATNINSQSSRSHAVFSLNLIQKKNAEGTVTIDSKLHFVDLAGSERLKNSGLSGGRVKEGISINAGLASLGKVISQLSSRAPGSHVSYRDSKLTRLLQDSLGGNAITYMVACVNPVEFHLSETLNTVQYAQRARAIQVRPQIQHRSDDSDKQVVIDRLRSEVAFLRDQIRVSQHAERRNNHGSERNDRSQERLNELQNQLLDIQENYGALSKRHAKLVKEFAEGKDANVDSAPALKNALENSAGARLHRSSNFSEAVEELVLEYEQTIRELENSLSTARSSLTTSESSLLEREAKIVYLEAVTQQLQARIQKHLNREANNETYLQELEAKLDGVTDGAEKQQIIVRELRQELARVKESEAAAEDYISTLEERLAEAEQDADHAQREIARLETIIERQRSIGKIDNLLHEIDHIRQGHVPQANGHKKHILSYHESQTDAFHDRLVATAGAYNPTEDMHPDSAEQEWKTFGPMEGEEDQASQSEYSVRGDEPTRGHHDKRVSAGANGEGYLDGAQARAIADKLETVTIELFDMKVEHDSTLQELDDVTSKYEIALRTLARLQDAMDESRHTPSSILGHRSHRPSDLSSHDSPTLVEPSEGGFALRDHNGIYPDGPQSKDELLVESIKALKRANAEKDININELTESYSQLQDQHQDTLNYIDELKEELQRAQAQASRASTPIDKRRSNLSKDRSTRMFATLHGLAADHLTDKPEAMKRFESSLNAVITDRELYVNRVKTLESEVAQAKKDRDVKNAMISGLTRERSLPTSSPIDMSLVTNMRSHIQETQQQLETLHKSSVARDEEVSSGLQSLKEVVPMEGGQADAQKKLSDWEAVHHGHAQASRESEQQILLVLSNLESSLRNAEQLHNEQAAARESRTNASDRAPSDFEAEKAKHLDQIASLQREIDTYKATADAHAAKLLHLENSYEQILKEVEDDAKTRELTEAELQTHRDLVMNLENQIDQQKSLTSFHQEGLASLQQSHTKELDELKGTLASHQADADRKLTEQLEKHQATTSGLQEELTKAHMEMAGLIQNISVALEEDGDPATLQARIKSLADERKTLSEKHVQTSEALAAAKQEMQDAKQLSVGLERKVQDLTSLNEETLKQLERSVQKEKKNSRIVQELEDQLTSSFNTRQSIGQIQLEKELEEWRQKTATLETQVAELKRQTIISQPTAHDSTDQKPPTTPTADDNRSSQGSNLRHSASVASLPASPPPAVPLPPLPGVTDAPASPPVSRHASSKDFASANQASQALAQLEESESKLKTIEKHLFQEKKLTATLEEALMDLEQQANRSKSEVEAWKKKCREVEEEASGLRREKGAMRNSIQAVEEERDRRIRAETAKRQLEERMAHLEGGYAGSVPGSTGGQVKKKKKGGLNCF